MALKTNQEEGPTKNVATKLTTHKNENWQMPEMVGFYNDTSLSVSPVQTAVEEAPLVKKVVCSPDLPLTTAADFATQAAQTKLPTGEQSNVCTICQKMFPNKSALQTHQRSHGVKVTEDQYRCNICSKTFAVPARLTRHYRTHTGEKPFRCEFCNKSFSVKENLSVHRRIHTKERPYKCEVCSRAFEHSGKLHRHMRIHTGERPHKCTVCAKTFIQSGQLVIHMRTHTGEKPYVCQVCQKGFTCSKQLKVHSRTHTGEKPYSCEICGKSFGYNHVLKLHQVAHYGEKVYKCTICNDTFNSKKSMEAHIKSHSENVPTPPISTFSNESSCSSLEKETRETPIAKQEPPMVNYDSNIRYYLYSRDRSYISQDYGVPASAGVELLAAAASVTEQEDRYGGGGFYDIIKSPQDVIAVLSHPAYLSASPTVPYTPINAGDDIRRRVEAALAVDEIHSEEDPILTPPSSNPVSPAPSPDPELSLPPRKRSKMILKSMESSKDMSPVRYSSVIHYARAS